MLIVQFLLACLCNVSMKCLLQLPLPNPYGLYLQPGGFFIGLSPHLLSAFMAIIEIIEPFLLEPR